jgi:SAM-dependent methyltransferase
MKRPTRTDLPSPREVREAYNQRYSVAPLRDSDRYYDWLARRVLEHVRGARRGAARCLDAGCGGGYFLAALLRREERPFASVHGLDIADAALRTVRATAPAAHGVLGQGEALPYASGCFDAVVCSGNLEHFIDPARGARELARVCRPDGRVWVLLPNSFYSGDIWRVIRSGYGPDHHQIVDRFATVNEWRDLLDANGLRVEEITPYNRFKWWKRLLPRNLAYHFLYRAAPARDG